MLFFEDFEELSCSRRFLFEGCDLEEFVTSQNPVCGDVVSIRAKVENEVIVDLAYQARACWPVFGCLELLFDRFKDKSVHELFQFSLNDFLDLVDETPLSKKHAFSLTYRGLKAAVTKASVAESSIEPRRDDSTQAEREFNRAR